MSVEQGVKNKNELHYKCKRPDMREQFWFDYDYLSFEQIVSKYFMPSKHPCYIIYNSTHKHTFSTKLLVALLKILYKVKCKLIRNGK